jgi:hypothetical protein
MDRCRKITVILLLFVICSVSKGQDKSIIIRDDVFFYVTMKECETRKDSQYYLLTLLVDNQSKDSIYIKKFNNHIFHKYDYTRNEKTFYWEFLTFSNQVPNDILVFRGGSPNNQIPGEDSLVVIPPNSMFASDIYAWKSSSIYYNKGYYKLCLYHKETEKCIAETIIEIK